MSDADSAAPARGLTQCSVELVLNGLPRVCPVPVERTAVDMLRDDMGLKGARIGCSRGVCGACVALVDGTPVATCSMFAFQLQGTEVTTIEGLALDGKLHRVQQAFIDCGAFQCGYCTSGMILLVKAMLDANPSPDRATIVEWLSSNVCRCTGYAQIIDAVERAIVPVVGESAHA